MGSIELYRTVAASIDNFRYGTSAGLRLFFASIYHRQFAIRKSETRNCLVSISLKMSIKISEIQVMRDRSLSERRQFVADLSKREPEMNLISCGEWAIFQKILNNVDEHIARNRMRYSHFLDDKTIICSVCVLFGEAGRNCSSLATNGQHVLKNYGYTHQKIREHERTASHDVALSLYLKNETELHIGNTKPMQSGWPAAETQHSTQECSLPSPVSGMNLVEHNRYIVERVLLTIIFMITHG